MFLFDATQGAKSISRKMTLGYLGLHAFFLVRSMADQIKYTVIGQIDVVPFQEDYNYIII